MREVIIDRFEGKFAVLEYRAGKTFYVPLEILPEGAQEGDVLKMNLKVDKGETDRRRARIGHLMDELFE